MRDTRSSTGPIGIAAIVNFPSSPLCAPRVEPTMWICTAGTGAWVALSVIVPTMVPVGVWAIAGRVALIATRPTTIVHRRRRNARGNDHSALAPDASADRGGGLRVARARGTAGIDTHSGIEGLLTSRSPGVGT